MHYILKIIVLLLIVHHNVETKALGKGTPLRKSFHFELLPFKSFSFMLENITPFGKFEMKHSLEKRDTVEDPIPNEIIPVPVEEKKVVMTSVVAPAVEAPIPVHAPKAVIPFVIELAPKPVEVPLPPPPPEPPVVDVPPPPPVEAPNGPLFYTDISQIPLINFAYNKPVPVEVPEVALGPVDAAAPIPPAPEEPVPVPVPVEPVVPPKPAPIVQEVIVKPILPVVVPPPPPAEGPAAVPPPNLPNYIVKGSRLIIFFGSKILQMLTQFIDGRSFNEFTLPQFPLPPLGKKK